MRDELAGQRDEACTHAVTDPQSGIAVRHQAEALVGIDQQDDVRRVGAQLFARRARDLSRRVNDAEAARLLFFRWCRPTVRAEVAPEIPDRLAGGAALIGDALRPRGPVENLRGRAHSASNTKLTWEESTPPSPCNSASEASFT